MIDLPERAEKPVAGAGLLCIAGGLLGLLVTVTEPTGQGVTVLSLLGLEAYGTEVFLTSLGLFGVGLTLGYVINQNTSDEERRGLDR